MAANSPEYRTIIKLGSELTTAFKASDELIKLSDEFLEANLINDDSSTTLKNPYTKAALRAADLTGWLRDKVKLDPKKNYKIFINVLKQRLSDHESILRKLDKKYKDLGGTVETGITAALDALDSPDTSPAPSPQRKRPVPDYSESLENEEEEPPNEQLDPQLIQKPSNAKNPSSPKLRVSTPGGCGNESNLKASRGAKEDGNTVAAKNWCTSKIFGVCIGILGVVSTASLAYKGFISDPYFIAFLSLVFISLIFWARKP